MDTQLERINSIVVNLCKIFFIIVEKISSKIREFYGDVDHNVSLFKDVPNFS